MSDTSRTKVSVTWLNIIFMSDHHIFTIVLFNTQLRSDMSMGLYPRHIVVGLYPELLMRLSKYIHAACRDGI